MFGIYSQFGLSSNYLCNKNYTISCFIILISNRANFAVRGPSSFDLYSALIAIEQWGTCSFPHLLWHGTSSCNLVISEDLWHTFVERLAVELSLHVLMTYGWSHWYWSMKMNIRLNISSFILLVCSYLLVAFYHQIIFISPDNWSLNRTYSCSNYIFWLQCVVNTSDLMTYIAPSIQHNRLICRIDDIRK